MDDKNSNVMKYTTTGLTFLEEIYFLYTMFMITNSFWLTILSLLLSFFLEAIFFMILAPFSVVGMDNPKEAVKMIEEWTRENPFVPMVFWFLMIVIVKSGMFFT